MCVDFDRTTRKKQLYGGHIAVWFCSSGRMGRTYEGCVLNCVQGDLVVNCSIIMFFAVKIKSMVIY